VRRLVIAIVLLVAGGLALLGWQPPAPSNAGQPANASLVNPALAVFQRAPRTPAANRPAAAPEVVPHKYRFLFEDLATSEEIRGRVLVLLARRESLAPPPDLGLTPAAPPDVARAGQLADIERALRRELSPAAYAAYELFRDSDVEQYQLDEFTGGLRAFAALERAQERAVLEAKLRHKQLYSQLVSTAGIERDSLSLQERELALQLVERGLQDYQQTYLAEVAPLLDARQYNALANFEATEFRTELERLQQTINTR
jgi:hypothetical protein